MTQDYRRGHHSYVAALDSIADLLMIAGITAASRDQVPDSVAARDEAWRDVDSWPWPRHGAPAAQPG